MLKDNEVWSDFFKLVYQHNHDKLSYHDMAREADHLHKEYLKRFPAEVVVKTATTNPPNTRFSYSIVDNQHADRHDNLSYTIRHTSLNT
jgi:hypothetical protein